MANSTTQKTFTIDTAESVVTTPVFIKRIKMLATQDNGTFTLQTNSPSGTRRTVITGIIPDISVLGTEKVYEINGWVQGIYIETLTNCTLEIQTK